MEHFAYSVDGDFFIFMWAWVWNHWLISMVPINWPYTGGRVLRFQRHQSIILFWLLQENNTRHIPMIFPNLLGLSLQYSSNYIAIKPHQIPFNLIKPHHGIFMIFHDIPKNVFTQKTLLKTHHENTPLTRESSWYPHVILWSSDRRWAVPTSRWCSGARGSRASRGSRPRWSRCSRWSRCTGAREMAGGWILLVKKYWDSI